MEWLYGKHAVLEALRSGRRKVHRAYLSPGARRSGSAADIVIAAQAASCPLAEASPQLLDRLGPVNHQGVIAEAAAYPYVTLDDVLPADTGNQPLYLVLDHLQDVQNLGTLLRTAEAMGVAGVLLPDRRSGAITPAAVNASAGAVEHLHIALVGNLVQALGRLKEAGVWIAGLDAHPDAVPLARADLSGALALVVGAEGSGLSRLVRESCDWLVAIPMHGKVESLNAAVAGSIVIAAARAARDALLAPGNDAERP